MMYSYDHFSFGSFNDAWFYSAKEKSCRIDLSEPVVSITTATRITDTEIQISDMLRTATHIPFCLVMICVNACDVCSPLAVPAVTRDESC